MPWATFLSQAGAWFGIWGIASVVLSGVPPGNGGRICVGGRGPSTFELFFKRAFFEPKHWYCTKKRQELLLLIRRWIWDYHPFFVLKDEFEMTIQIHCSLLHHTLKSSRIDAWFAQDLHHLMITVCICRHLQVWLVQHIEVVYLAMTVGSFQFELCQTNPCVLFQWKGGEYTQVYTPFHCGFTIKKRFQWLEALFVKTYCWWFRNPAPTVNNGTNYHINWWVYRISEPSNRNPKHPCTLS